MRRVRKGKRKANKRPKYCPSTRNDKAVSPPLHHDKRTCQLSWVGPKCRHVDPWPREDHVRLSDAVSSLGAGFGAQRRCDQACALLPGPQRLLTAQRPPCPCFLIRCLAGPLSGRSRQPWFLAVRPLLSFLIYFCPELQIPHHRPLCSFPSRTASVFVKEGSPCPLLVTLSHRQHPRSGPTARSASRLTILRLPLQQSAM